jgi:hypothetical protein
MKAEAAILRPVVNSDQNKRAVNFKTCETLTLRVCVRQAVALADILLKQRLCLLLAQAVCTKRTSADAWGHALACHACWPCQTAQFIEADQCELPDEAGQEWRDVSRN